MLRQLLSFSAACFLVFGMSCLSLAEGNESSNNTSTNDSQTERISFKSELSDTARAIRMEFIGGTLEYIKNNARARVKLEWELLPSDDSLTESVRKYGARMATIQISNEDLGEEQNWKQAIQEVNDEEQRALLNRALPTPENEARFKKNWSQEENSNWKSWLTTSVKPSEYFALLREHNIINAILNRSKGVGFSFQVPSISYEKFLNENITWQINVYEFCVSEGCQDAYYRFTAKAATETFEVLIPRNSLETLEKDKDGKPITTGISVKAGANLIRSPGLTGLLDDVRSVSLGTAIKTFLDPPRKELLDELEKKNAANQLEGFLTFVGGRNEFGRVITSGILGGTSDTSIISGGLIDFGNDKITPLVGVNREFNPLDDVVAGLLFGVGLDDDSSLYLGPSIRASAFTFSFGTNILEQDNSLKVNGSGLLSVDLSRLVRDKRDENVVSLKEPQVGGGWYRASNEFAKDLTLVEWGLKVSSGQEFKLRQICNASGEFISDSNQQAVLIVEEERQLQFIPRGYYKIEGIPINSQLVVDEQGTTAPVTDFLLPFREDKFKSITWELKPSDTSEVNKFMATENNMEMERQLCPNTVKPDSQTEIEGSS